MLDRNPIDENILEEIYQVIEPFIDVLKDNPIKKVVPDWEKYISKEYLDEIDYQFVKGTLREIDVAKNKNKNLIRVLTRPGDEVESIEHGWTLSKLRFIDFGEIEWLVQSAFPKKRVQLSGDFYYPPTGFMGWHTNHDAPCERLYINYASEDNKSFFRYFEGGQIVTDYDKIGMNARKFTCTGERPYFWHCVGSECDRISFGFKLL